MMVPAYTSAKEDEAERLWVQGLPGLYNKSLFLKEKKIKGCGLLGSIPNEKQMDWEKGVDRVRGREGRQRQAVWQIPFKWNIKEQTKYTSKFIYTTELLYRN